MEIHTETITQFWWHTHPLNPLRLSHSLSSFLTTTHEVALCHTVFQIVSSGFYFVQVRRVWWVKRYSLDSTWLCFSIHSCRSFTIMISCMIFMKLAPAPYFILNPLNVSIHSPLQNIMSIQKPVHTAHTPQASISSFISKLQVKMTVQPAQCSTSLRMKCHSCGDLNQGTDASIPSAGFRLDMNSSSPRSRLLQFDPKFNFSPQSNLLFC